MNRYVFFARFNRPGAVGSDAVHVRMGEYTLRPPQVRPKTHEDTMVSTKLEHEITSIVRSIEKELGIKVDVKQEIPTDAGCMWWPFNTPMQIEALIDL